MAQTLLVSYDLKSPETSSDYARLIEYIKSFAGYCKPLYSFWFVKTDKSCSEVRDEIKKRIDSNDKVVVVQVTGSHWASVNLTAVDAEWMKNNL